MRLKDNIVSHKVDKDFVTIFTSENPEDFHGILRSNDEAKFIIDCLQEETTEDEILARLQEEYEGDASAMLEDIRIVLGHLRTAGALVE